jgi:predicted DNA-binding transcriptional regulator AlpA
MTPKAQPAVVPASLEDVTLIDAPTAAKAAGISVSTWHNLVREKKAPQGARFGARCTRWKAGEVRAWIVKRWDDAQADDTAATVVTARAKKASAAAKVKRVTSAAAQ